MSDNIFTNNPEEEEVGESIGESNTYNPSLTFDIPKPSQPDPYAGGDESLTPRVSNEYLEINKPEDTGFVDGFLAERNLNNSLGSMKVILDSYNFEPDPTFNAGNPEMQETYYQDVDVEYHDYLDEAVSEKDLEYRKNQLKHELEAEEVLSKAGWDGRLGQFLGAVSDEGMWLSILASEGMAAPWIMASKGKRLAQLGKGALVSGAAVAPAEAVMASESATKDASDALAAIALSAALGAPMTKGVQLFGKSHEFDDLAHELASGIREGRLDHAGAARVVNSNLDETDDVVSNYTHGGDIEVTDVPLNSNLREEAIDKARISTVGVLSKSPVEKTRVTARKLGEDAVRGGQPSAALIQDTELHRLYTRVNRVSVPAFQEWKKAKNLPWRTKANPVVDADLRRSFFEEVDEVIRSGVKSQDDAINRTADAMVANNREMLQMLKSAGVKGFDDIVENDQYLTRLWSGHKYQALESEIGASGIQRLLKEAIEQSMDQIDETLSKRLASALVKVMRSKAMGNDVSITRLFSDADYDTLAERLKEFGIDDIDIDGAIEQLRFSKDKAKDFKGTGRDARARRKIKLDENYSTTIGGREVSVRELFETNAEQVHLGYLRYGAGRYALAKHGFKSEGDFRKAIEEIREEGFHKGRTAEQTNAEVEKLQIMHDTILGKPIEDMTTGKAQAMRMVRDLNYVRVMNQVGFAQLAEIGNLVGQNTWKSVLAHIPVLKQSIKTLTDGKRADPLMREIEEFVGAFGRDRLLHQATTRADELGYGVGKAGSKLNKLDTALQYGTRITSDISGMSVVNQALQVMAVRTSAQKFMNEALKSQMSAATLKRMKVLIPNEDDLQAVLKELRTNATTEKNWLTGRKLNQLNLDKWNPRVRDIFKYALNRDVYKIIQKNFVGELPTFMSKNTWKLVTQFRTFMVGAHEKQLLSNLHTPDWQTASSWLHSMFFAGLAYTAQTYVNGVGRSDRKQYYSERLSAEAIGLSAFQRAGFASMIPAGIDTGASMFLDDPIFAYGRSTGLASNALMGIPTVDFANKAFKAAAGVTKSAARDDYEFSEHDFRNTTSILWFSNAVGIRNLLNLMGEELPERSK
nr:hypothetical protein 16 [Gammaproteobacteria bacterium]